MPKSELDYKSSYTDDAWPFPSHERYTRKGCGYAKLIVLQALSFLKFSSYSFKMQYLKCALLVILSAHAQESYSSNSVFCLSACLFASVYVS